eukprot:g16380.t1
MAASQPEPQAKETLGAGSVVNCSIFEALSPTNIRSRKRSLFGGADLVKRIKTPMDLGTIRRKVISGAYTNDGLEGFRRDVQLICDNAIEYNGEGSWVSVMAAEMKQKMENRHEQMVKGMELGKDEIATDMKQGTICTLCAQADIFFKRPGTNIVIREVSAKNKVFKVKPGFAERYRIGKEGYPAEFPYTSRCIALFQKQDGVDVLLFGLYVIESGSECPEPNKRQVVINYLDSVHYFEPRRYREVGRTAMDRGILDSVTNFVDEFLLSAKNADLREIPYLEGQYWVDLAEEEIKNDPTLGVPLATTSGSSTPTVVAEVGVAAGEGNSPVGVGVGVDGTGAGAAAAGEAETPATTGTGGGGPSAASAPAPAPAPALPSALGDTQGGVRVEQAGTATGGRIWAAGQPAQAEAEPSTDERKVSSSCSKASVGVPASIQLGFPVDTRDLLVRKLAAKLGPIKETFLVLKLKPQQETVAPIKGEGAKPGAVQVNVGEDVVGNAGTDGKQIVPHSNKNSALVGGKGNSNHEAKGEQQAVLQCKVLYHMHEPDVPWVLPKCYVCGQGISAAKGSSCTSCVDWSVCNECVIDAKPHEHKLDVITQEWMKERDIAFSHKAEGAT